MKTKALFVLLIVAALGGYIGWNMYNKPVSQTTDLKTDLQVDAQALFAEFEQDENAANQKYNDKAIEVSGVITGIEAQDGKTTVALKGGDMGGVSCEMQDASGTENLKPGDAVVIKGVCTGVLMDVVLVRCVLKK
ncbi:MAG: hypothetical protein IPM47_20575 [Sphingobacteriales bacterium]|nr:MAG: hypothetical protein IPM47_20575 [Sphingobacteriales bacterium]